MIKKPLVALVIALVFSPVISVHSQDSAPKSQPLSFQPRFPGDTPPPMGPDGGPEGQDPIPNTEATPTPTPTVTPTPDPPSYGIAWEEGQTPVAIGAKTTSAHQADFTLTLVDEDGEAVSGAGAPTVEVLSGGLGPNDSVTARISLASSTTDSNGKIKGTFTSGNRLETTTIGIRKTPGDKESDVLTSISTEQVWNELGDNAWDYEPYFYYGESSDIKYRMAYTRDDAEVNITGHSMEPETTAISGYEWDYDAGEDWDEDGLPDGDYSYETYDKDDADSSDFDYWSGLVEWGGVSESNGTYTVPQTIKYDEDFEVDSIYFWLWDRSSFGPAGKPN